MRTASIDESNFSIIRKLAPPIHVSLDGKVTIFQRQTQDEKYDAKRYSIGYTTGTGTRESPLQYSSAADVSPHYGIIDLWFGLHGNQGPTKMFIKVNDWVLEVVPFGVRAEDGVFTKLI
ncbi:MAG: hypothetical protein Athens101428_49 [Candidatus Berkelbacteria bacterium Athens1014_28]|uniref:Uncharacterized protein n=1 Tax=Candidatus Berkelbacteria bacterium Athens1014_28 TaxID=2017145 RepID=A0A554LQ30_9BACT|nr:MAG: hypothetical protein Athens101428_49 [Candidatus Berkelbacteria bacterium Athens1014_28]